MYGEVRRILHYSCAQKLPNSHFRTDLELARRAYLVYGLAQNEGLIGVLLWLREEV